MKRCFGFVLVILAAGLAASAADGPFTLEQVMSSPFPSDLAAAPTGSRIAWVFDAQGRRNIWVAGGPRFVARQLTQYKAEDGQEITSLSFSSPYGEFIVFVRGGNKNSAGEVPNPTSDPAGVQQAVWAVSWQGGLRKIDSGNSPAVSPKGDWVAYVKDNQVWLASIVGRSAPERVSNQPRSPAAGRLLYFPKPVQIVARGQNSSPVWSPDGKKLAFVSNRGSHSLIAVYDRVKKKLGYVAPTVDRDNFPRWSPDGNALAFIRLPARTAGQPVGGFLTAADRPNPWAIWVARFKPGAESPFWSAEMKEIWHSSDTLEGSLPMQAGRGLLNWAAEDRIIFASEEDGWRRLYSIPATGGTPVLLTPGECEFEHTALTPNRREVVYSSNCGDIDRRHLWRIAVTGGSPEQITSGEGIEWSPIPIGEGKWMAYFASNARQPAMPFIRTAEAKGEGRMLAAQALPKDFPSAKLVVPQQVIFEAADGMRIHGQVFLPAESGPGAKHPAVIFMHGGPVRQMLLGWHYLYYYHNSYAMNQYLASRGYVVLSVNYRSGIGYGRAFRVAPNRGARGASEYQDIVAGARYLASRGDVNPSQIGLWGGSYGGYLTAMGLARNSDLFAAGVDLHGVHDWTRRGFMGGAMDQQRLRVARESSPVASVDKWRSPVLLIQGDDDRNVNFDQMVDLVPQLRQQKVPFEQIVFPDEVHDFLLHRHWLAAYQAASDFFDRYLKPAGQQAAPAAGE